MHYFTLYVSRKLSGEFLPKSLCRLIVILLVALNCCVARAEIPVKIWWSSELLPEDERWFTNPPEETEIQFRLQRQPDLKFEPLGSRKGTTFRIDPGKRFQTISGIGTSLEETTVYAILKNKSDAQIRELLKALIDPARGIGLNLFRITIGTSDFSDARAVSQHPQGFYSYQDREDAPFSIQNDQDLGIVKVLQMAREVAQNLVPPQEIRFFASCWSPPGWMKTSGTLIGGSLKPGYENHLARYFRQFIEAYAAHGIPIYAMTLQNEPNYLPEKYPGMKLTWQQEHDLARAICENFRQPPALPVKVWINDHNFEYWVNADSVLMKLKSAGKGTCVDAVAFHNYSDAPVENMSRLKQRHPDTDVLISEHSEFGVRGMAAIQDYFRQGATAYTYWVTMSTQTTDEHNQGPWNHLGELSPTMLIKRDGDNPDWYRTPEYFLIGQFSKFIRRGARRITCETGNRETLTAVAFQNPDRSIVVVLVNQTEFEQNFRLLFRGQQVCASLPAKSVATCLWQTLEK
ncbi:glycosyl hydrolase [candidate division KSB1 bacterium]|nr:glycosyl hydrolase [candidate division KSB1 bacterium]